MATSFITSVGRRKTAVANVRMSEADKDSVTINGKTPKEFFKTDERAKVVLQAFEIAEATKHYRVSAYTKGGGVSAQADAVRHAMTRAIMKSEPETRAKLKLAGFVTRDPRAKERKKPGLVKARKRKQWSKR